MDIRVVSLIDMSTFSKTQCTFSLLNIATTPFKIYYHYFASHYCCIEEKWLNNFLLPFLLIKIRFYWNKRESILPISMCHSLSFSFFVHLIHLRLFIFMSCKKSHQKIFSHCKWKKRKFWMESDMSQLFCC